MTDMHAVGPSQTGITYAVDIPPSGNPTSPGPNIDKDLPDVPSVSTGLWGSNPVLEPLRSEVFRPPKEVSSYLTSHSILFFWVISPSRGSE
jgi:hypothetical protein